jgi:hypothetical protein
MTPNPENSVIFISYSHRDTKEKEELEKYLKGIESLELWSDTHIGAGQQWRPEIDNALTRASVAVLLITANFLASSFVNTEEVPEILLRKKDNGLRVFPLIARECPWRLKPWLSDMQVRPPDAKPIWRRGGSVEQELTLITYEVAEAVKEANLKRQMEREGSIKEYRFERKLAAHRKHIEEEIQQKRAILSQVDEAENNSAEASGVNNRVDDEMQMQRWKILQEMQAKIFETQGEISKIKLAASDRAFNKWDEYLRA